MQGGLKNLNELGRQKLEQAGFLAAFQAVFYPNADFKEGIFGNVVFPTEGP